MLDSGLDNNFGGHFQLSTPLNQPTRVFLQRATPMHCRVGCIFLWLICIRDNRRPKLAKMQQFTVQSQPGEENGVSVWAIYAPEPADTGVFVNSYAHVLQNRVHMFETDMHSRQSASKVGQNATVHCTIAAWRREWGVGLGYLRTWRDKPMAFRVNLGPCIAKLGARSRGYNTFRGIDARSWRIFNISLSNGNLDKDFGGHFEVIRHSRLQR